MKPESKQEMNWKCSSCNRRFVKIENLKYHVLRNRVCSARNAKHIRLRVDPQQRQRKANRILVKQEEYKLESASIRQRPAAKVKRTGVRSFPPALIARIAKEGKELAKVHGRWETGRILMEKYPMANLSRYSVDR